MNRKRLVGSLVLSLTVSCPLSGSSGATSAKGFKPAAPSIGINLSMLGSAFPEIPFADAFKGFDPWLIQGTATQGKTTIRNGWVTSLAKGQFAQACAFKGFTQGHYPAGRYTVLYDGRGTLTVRGSLRIEQASPGRIVLDVTPSSDPRNAGICLIETATLEADPIRNIRVIFPGREQTYQSDVFYPPFLDELKPFKTIRFMPWAGIARSKVVNWEDRRPANYATQAISFSPTTEPVTFTGVALEYQIQLANRLSADPWLNVPVKASDDYIRQMAIYVHRNLRPDLHPYIEFSNEIWNGRFQSDYRYARDMGTSMKLDVEHGGRLAGLHWYALRASQMFDIWNDVYGPDAHRIAHVIAGQQSWPGEAEIILSYRDTYKKADVLAVGGYASPFSYPDMVNPQSASRIADMSPAEIMERLNGRIAASAPNIAMHKNIANKFGLALAIYEGGTNFETEMAPLPYRTRIQALFATVQADPALGEAYKKLLDVHFRQGVTTFNHFCDVMPPQAGGHGALNYQDQPLQTSSKYVTMKNYFLRASSR